jgi:Tfp pilus assembly protein PilV
MEVWSFAAGRRLGGISKPMAASSKTAGGFSLAETLVSTMIVAVTLVSLYAGFSSGFAAVQATRESLRATQVLLEKFETIRLYSWEQLNQPGFVPTYFHAPFNPGASNVNSGFQFNGVLRIEPPPLSESYSNDVRQVTIEVSWTSGTQTRSRSFSTLVSRYGLQHYVY